MLKNVEWKGSNRPKVEQRPQPFCEICRLRLLLIWFDLVNIFLLNVMILRFVWVWPRGGDFAGPKRSDLKAMLENLGNNGEVPTGSPRGNNNAAPSNDVEEGNGLSVVWDLTTSFSPVKPQYYEPPFSSGSLHPRCLPISSSHSSYIMLCKFLHEMWQLLFCFICFAVLL